MGTVIIGISYFIQTDTITIDVILISIPIAIFIGAIMLSNNIRDRAGDEESGRKTIAILLGHDRAVNFLASLFIVAYVLTAIFIIFGILSIISFIVFFHVSLASSFIIAY